MNWRQLEIPFEEYKDRQLYLKFKEKTEQEIAEVLEDDDWYDPMLLDYMLNKHEE